MPGADGLLDRLVVFDGSCRHTIDPATVLITSHLTLNLPGRFPLPAADEYLAEDVNKFAGLAAPPEGRGAQPAHRRPAPAQPALAGDAATQQLRRRAAGGLGGLGAGCWGSLILVRDPAGPTSTPETMVAVERLAGTLVNGLRGTLVAQQAAVEQTTQGPGLVVLDRHGQVESLTPAARHWLDHLGDAPPVLSAVAASAQAGGPARARVRAPTGQWLILHGARLDGDPQGRLSVIVEPPRPADLARLLVAPYGLSDREQAVTALVLQGRSTRQIARALSISPDMVQEHLTAVFDKVGVRSRGELVGQVFLRHCLPAIPD